MVLTTEVTRDNPWWKNRQAIEEDPQLRRLENQPFTHRHELENFNYCQDAVYTLRGPRQVGKTTLLKMIIRYLLKSESYRIQPRDILYLNVQAVDVSTHNDLQNLIQEFIEDRRTLETDNRLYLFLDEVTGITDWGKAIQSLHGRGLTENVFILATGSHALDIKRGGERMPGRRGKIDHPDWVLLPLSFQDYVKALAEQSTLQIPDKIPEIDLFDIKKTYESARELQMYSPPVDNLFQRYLQTGGYPYAISAEIGKDMIPEGVYRQFQHAIREEMRKAGRRETYFRELVAWAVDKHLGKEFSWSTASSDTHIGSKNTARNYLEDGEGVFIWHIMNRVINIGEPTPAPKSPKKLYTLDPFCWHSLTTWVEGQPDPWSQTLEVLANNNFLGDFVESIVADHLKRRFGHFALYHRSSQGKEEIDFVLHKSPEEYSLVEVKHRNEIKQSDRKYLDKYGGGIVATKNQLNYNEKKNIVDIPIHDLLLGFPDDLTLFPSRE